MPVTSLKKVNGTAFTSRCRIQYSPARRPILRRDNFGYAGQMSALRLHVGDVAAQKVVKERCLGQVKNKTPLLNLEAYLGTNQIQI